MKKKKKANPWADHLTRQARADDYPARSVYKLVEIQNKFKVIAKGDHILDLGCAPGSWLIYAARQAGPGGRALGIDLKPVTVDLPANASAVVGDIKADDLSSLLSGEDRFQAVLSDMAPATTGRKDVDALRSLALCEMALETARQVLLPGGHFVCKIFQGQDFSAFTRQVKPLFKQMKIFKPDSCRKSSKEIYMIGKEYK